MAYQAIENYGIIGDLHTVALVGMDGSIDFMCAPRFDSASVFAAIANTIAAIAEPPGVSTVTTAALSHSIKNILQALRGGGDVVVREGEIFGIAGVAGNGQGTGLHGAIARIGDRSGDLGPKAHGPRSLAVGPPSEVEG